MSGAECVCRILAHLDARGLPDGNMVDLDVEAVEIVAGWTGAPGVLCDALIKTAWIDSTADGMFWHDYSSFNGVTLGLRANASDAGKRSWESRKARGYGISRDSKGRLRTERPGEDAPNGHTERQTEPSTEPTPEPRSVIQAKKSTERTEPSSAFPTEPQAEQSVYGSGSGSCQSPKEKNQIAGEAPARPRIPPLAEAWNAAAEPAGLARVSKVAPSRAKHIAARLREEPDIDVWARAFALIAADPFCKGDNDRGWRADFDYALRPEKCGKWLDLARSGTASPESPFDRLQRILGAPPNEA